MKDTKINTKEIVELAMMCAMMFIGKEAMNLLPNIHPVTVIILLCVLLYGWKAMYPTIGFALLEIAIYGLGMWSITYLYIWPLFVAVSMPFREDKKWINLALISGLFGLSFGALTAIVTLVTSGVQAAIAYWIAGIPFDLIHGVSNFLLTWLLLPVLYNTINKVRQRNIL